MHSYCKKIIAALMFGVNLLSLYACNIEESYKEFYISNVTDKSIQDYASSNDLDFARINNVTIIPEIKEIRHGEYIVYISAHSSVEPENLELKNVTLSTNGKSFIKQEHNTIIPMNLNQNGVYEGYVTGAIFSDNIVDISNGQKMILSVCLQHNKGTETVTKDIIYEVFVKTYKAWVTPV